MSSRKLNVGLLAAGVSVMVLGGCAMQHPNAMPTGYTYHSETYKSATPPPSRRITKEQRKHIDGAQAEQFRDAVYGLLRRITNRAGMPPKPVYVLAPDPMTPFYGNIDNDLREGMRHMGYAISDTATGAYVFTYDARLINQQRDRMSAGDPNVELVIKVFNKIGEDAQMLTEEVGRYYIQGAESLHIQPSRYRLLPSRETIMKQAEGFDPAAEQPRTATQMEMKAVHHHHGEPHTMREKMISSHGSQPAPQEGPMHAVTIDSNGVSRAEDAGAPHVNREPLSPRSRVSKQIEY